MTEPYWTDGQVTLYLGDCREVAEWLAADVLVTDPPYGRNWQPTSQSRAEPIAGDKDSRTRDTALALWDNRAAIVFGDLTLAPPPGNRQTLIYRKPHGSNCGTGGWLRDAEAIYLLGPWPNGWDATRSSVIASNARKASGAHGMSGRYGHPHAKPVDVMETLIATCAPGCVADPFAGSGSTLIAARNQRRRAIGVEIDESYCEMAARRLSQGILEAI